ncbi:uncharacterized protein LOC110050704 [Orbicella faveolata]|uniref:uncharacterized protein LOC110050704 n=1 Tax=Orbicella faveolata TaxID=48498 RepID=UPI0009E48059|nr:uncharacterized protein LOC110050704 [Orbicella faveolata]
MHILVTRLPSKTVKMSTLPECMKVLIKEEEKSSYIYKDIPVPQPNTGDLLLKVLKVSICGSDTVLYQWNEAARTIATLPFIPGHECVGEVVQVGPGCGDEFSVGQRVCCENHFYCGKCYQCLHGKRCTIQLVLTLSQSVCSSEDNIRFVENIAHCTFLCRKGGKVVLVGLLKQPLHVENFLQDILFRSLTIKTIHGRKIYSTWEKSEELLFNNKVDVTPVITHEIPMSQFEQAFKLLKSGKGCKIMVDPHT